MHLPGFRVRSLAGFYVNEVQEACEELASAKGYVVNRKKGVSINMRKEGFAEGRPNCNFVVARCGRDLTMTCWCMC